MKINDLKSLRIETERLQYKIKVDKELLITETKLLKYRLFEDALKALTALFKRDVKKEEL